MKEEEKIMHYSSYHRILLVGEGDFSFAACSARAFGSAPNIIATSLDSQGFIYKEHSFEQIRLHQELVQGFLSNASSMLSYDGQVHITHKTAYTFSAWDRVGLAKKVSMRLVRSVQFLALVLPGVCK
ncbi:uncharacterized protein At4g26485-like [Punica granatum]|uniref:Uncharacterized protein At4g26485-like n=1 Tax=Punica granatum TaxID=22663 RepID=A0A218XLT3_PUNGR|nr:uncharacterized protein At4g26485-like [Punica granatum]OWM85913.1 hypothetical protein CDL15_Pgr012163 [Punica granatum]